MIDPDILRGAIKRAAGNELGLTEDQVIALETERLRQRVRGIRPADQAEAAAFSESTNEVPNILKEFDVSGEASLNEYGLDQADMILKVDLDK